MSTENKVYKETKDECQRKLDEWDVVCSGCGGKLEPIETVDNSDSPAYWPGCLSCSVFDYGVKQEVYDIAKKMVIEHNFTPYSHLENPWGMSEEYKQQYYVQQIRGASPIVNTILKLSKTPNQ